jgi:hypothetical protein
VNHCHDIVIKPFRYGYMNGNVTGNVAPPSAQMLRHSRPRLIGFQHVEEGTDELAMG